MRHGKNDSHDDDNGNDRAAAVDDNDGDNDGYLKVAL